MDFDQFIDILLSEGENYLRNLVVPLTLLLLFSIIMLRGLNKYELGKFRRSRRDKVIEEILNISHTYAEYLDQFHIRSKYNPATIETQSEKLALEMSTLTGLSAVYFAKAKNINQVKAHMKELRSLYTLLSAKREPFQPVSPSEYVTYQEEFAEIIQGLMKTVRHSKMI